MPDCTAPGGGKHRHNAHAARAASAAASDSSARRPLVLVNHAHGGDGHTISHHKTTKHTTEVMEQVVVEKRVEMPNDVTVVVDVSGSMAGGKLTAAKEGMRLIFTEVLGVHDRMSVWIFSDVAERILPMTKKSDVDIDDVLRRIALGSITALFDAVDAAMNDMEGASDRTLQLVVLTDGEDNNSKRVSQAALTTRIQKPGLANFHLIAVAVGVEAETNLAPLCACAPRHCNLIKVDNGAAGIKKAFGDCVKTIREVRQRVHTEVKTQKVVSDGRGRKHIEPAAGGRREQ